MNDFSKNITPLSKQVIIGAACWILTLEYFIAQIVAQMAWPTYSISQYDVSALGVTSCGPFTDPTTRVTMYMCSPLHVVMNAGFVLLGVLTVLGVFLLWQAWPRRRLAATGLVFVALGGLGEVLAGSAPGDVNLALHTIGALLHWIGGGVGILLLGFAIWKTRRLMALFSLICGTITIVGFFLYGGHTYLNLGRGGMERLLAYPLTIWLIVAGISLLAIGGREPIRSLH